MEPTIINVESHAKRLITEIQNNQESMKTDKESLESILLNDPSYAALEEQMTELKLKLAEAKKSALNRPEAQQVVQRMKEKKEVVKECKQSLSTTLEQYVSLSGLTTLEMDDGSIINIKKEFKVGGRQ